ncbi:hypothetical protein FJY93_00860 [Candidatus Kaiserbacteria bacterium]|nr:hypothetical protein [Candidatus Kaiserbacteria bacterium]
MSNLLPIPAEQELLRAFRMQLLLLASLFLIGVGIIAGVILVPSSIIVKKNRASLESGIAALNASTTDSVDMELLSHMRMRMDVLAPLVLATTTPSEMIQTVLAFEHSGISISRIAYNKDKVATIILSGSAVSSESISAFQRTLLSSGTYAKVSVPVGALAGVDNDRFNITITGK